MLLKDLKTNTLKFRCKKEREKHSGCTIVFLGAVLTTPTHIYVTANTTQSCDTNHAWRNKRLLLECFGLVGEYPLWWPRCCAVERQVMGSILGPVAVFFFFFLRGDEKKHLCIQDFIAH